MRRFGLLLLAMTLLAGCEERVVGVKNSWVGSQYEYAEERYPPQKKQADPLKSVGNTLFGWTDGLFGSKKRPRTGEQIGEINPNQSFGQPREERSP
ncbi:MAG: hypothetical protein GC162_13280 [Planctomycetes bacterium]|nr:hypothetical protein [Planctomycetota bacterium]